MEADKTLDQCTVGLFHVSREFTAEILLKYALPVEGCPEAVRIAGVAQCKKRRLI